MELHLSEVSGQVQSSGILADSDVKVITFVREILSLTEAKQLSFFMSRSKRKVLLCKSLQSQVRHPISE